MNLQLIKWHIRWLLSPRWRESTKRRVLKAKAAAEFVSKPLKLTALRRFVMGRLG